MLTWRYASAGAICSGGAGGICVGTDLNATGDERAASATPPLTVIDLVQQTGLGLSVVVDAGRLQAEARRAYVTDLPEPGRYLSAGDLVLTSGTWYRGDSGPQDCARFVDSVAGSGAVALVVGLLVLRTMPRALIETCARRGLPLLTIAPDRSFAPVIETVLAHNLVGPTAAVRQAAAFHRRLVETVSRAQGVGGILEVFGDEYDTDCWVVSPAGAVLAAAGAPPSPAEVFAGWSHALTSADDGGEGPGGLPVPGEPSAVHVIRAPGPAAGVRGVLARRPRHPGAPAVPPEPVLTVLGLLAMELDLLGARHSAGQSRVAELIDVLGADSAAPGEVSAHLRLIGADPRLPIVMVAAALEGGAVAQHVVADLFTETLAPLNGDVTVAGCATDTEVLLIVNGEGTRPDALADAARDLAGRYRPLLGRGRLLVGISEPTTSVSQLAAALDVARRRLLAARGGQGRFSVVSATDTDSHLVLLAALPERLRESYRDRLLGPLLAYDASRGSQLRRTLASFLETCGSWQRSAEELHVHVNTLRYRVQRIEELTGRDLSSMRDRTDLYLALELLPEAEQGAVFPAPSLSAAVGEDPPDAGALGRRTG
ncbi:transcriptional regulator, PucR family [Actinobacteria bacterium OK074]|nr:transcriptional regulator, PucR family [Actinobacteria bacterium OK074]